MNGHEIERRWVTTHQPDGEQHLIVQGYLTNPGSSMQLRIRREDDLCTMAVKIGHGLQRIEHEHDISPDEFDRMWPLTQGRRIRKNRTYVALDAGLTAHVDQYLDLDLVSIEVEFDTLTDAETFQAPAWFGREVTGDEQYSNDRLAR